MSADTALVLDPRKEQRPAADPVASVWVAASAGTGKTTVLTNRVLSLLLAGTPPPRILCLTFTKAAAAEMANRIASSLGEWATIPDKNLAGELTELTGKTPPGDQLERARRLFAQVVDAPGGLKIETIHAFCQSLLRRFPLEAGLTPHFQVIDERSSGELMERARDEVLLRARHGVDERLALALAEVTRHVSEDEFHKLMTDLAKERGRLARLLGPRGGLKSAVAAVYRRLGLKPSETPERILASACRDSALDHTGLRAAAKALAQGSKTDQERGQAIADWLADVEARIERWNNYVSAFITDEGTIRKTLATQAVLKVAPDVDDSLRAEAERLLLIIERVKAATTAAATTALLRLGSAVLAAYERQKAYQALLDYDDLIFHTRRLLERRGAEWVLYKLDKGLDHILIDEAQDTNPDQWHVVAAIAEEFFAGEGAREETRTVFAVGDAKQSIFSFQRADPTAFEAMRRHFAEKVKQAAGTWRSLTLEVSFRSTPAVLQAVDAVFGRAAAGDGMTTPGETIRHLSFRQGHAGLVELWPPVIPQETPPFEAWAPPVRRVAMDSPPARLAALIAARIKRWIDDREPLESKGRPIRAGDIMVLVRRRNIFVEELVRSLKAASVPVAGIDRMVLTDQLAVMDLIALARFLLLPEDDLTLGTVLKSPLVGFDEEELFDLAYHRGDRSLWQELVRRADETPARAAAHAYLAALLKRVDFSPPYELFAEILGARGKPDSRSGRERILARLGPEAEEPLDEFLAQALVYERSHVPSLEGFLHWVLSGEGEIKRDPESSARDEVRIMTVHGAKGLEAPIVILPDTLQTPSQSPRLLWNEEEDGFLWPPHREHEEAVAQNLREAANIRRDQEYRRLLYVAMTRAADRLYVCGWEPKKGRSTSCWYDLVRAGLGDLVQRAPGSESPGVAERFAFDCTGEITEGWSGEGLRLSLPQTAAPEEEMREGGLPTVSEPLPLWTRQAPPPEPVPAQPLAPSLPPEEEPAVRSPLGPDEGLRFRRGLLVHRLLEALPKLAPEAREAACRRYLARSTHNLSGAEQKEIAAETLAVLADPAFARLFGHGARSEVPLVGEIEDVVISGQVDRLVMTEDEVLVVDYKTNRPPPATAEEVAALYLKQMAAYRALLREIYPGRRVRTALLWTDGPRLMPLPDGLLDAHEP